MPHDRVDPDPAFERLIDYIQQSRGVDFRGYKRTSLRRRITLRMQELGVESFDSYQDMLESNPPEFGNLLDTVLINVTSFFRDPEAWEALRTHVVPVLVRSAAEGRPIRVWSVGCASGEEPFSVAMLLAEVLGVRSFCDLVKIYATDLDNQALRTARLATYSAREVETLDPGLRERYFEATDAGFVFQRELRKCVIFGRHNLVADAPISRIDLLICRNLLIYFASETQAVVLPRLHYALTEQGFLFLGKAETQLARSPLFSPLDMRNRLFLKVAQDWRRIPGDEAPSAAAKGAAHLMEVAAEATSVGYVVLDSGGRLVFTNPAARRMADLSLRDVGRPFRDLPLSYRPIDLRSRIDEVMATRKPMLLPHLDFQRASGEALRLTVEITQLGGRDGYGPVLLAFTDTTRLHDLEAELQVAQESMETVVEELQSSNEELETTNEELQSTNEELETTNEELQSTNEELETMNEELRSSNEEAEAANQELARQSSEIVEFRAYADSVLRSLDAGLIVIDLAGRVKLWNRWSEKILGLRAEDAVGAPLLELDVGLPLAQLQDGLRATAGDAAEQWEAQLEVVDRRARLLQCRVRIMPLNFSDGSRHGAVLMIENAAAPAPTPSPPAPRGGRGPG